jgi:hypothetical protein
MATWGALSSTFKRAVHPKIFEEKLKTGVQSSTFLQIFLGVSFDYRIIHPNNFSHNTGRVNGLETWDVLLHLQFHYERLNIASDVFTVLQGEMSYLVLVLVVVLY